MYSITLKLFTFMALLLFVPAVLASQMYVLDLEGNGQINLERQHHDVSPSAEIESAKASEIICQNSSGHCSSTNHVSLAYLSRNDAVYYHPNLASAQTFLSFFVQPLYPLTHRTFTAFFPHENRLLHHSLSVGLRSKILQI